MNHLTDNESQAHTRMLTTNELAFKLAMEPQSIRKRWSQTGSYFNIWTGQPLLDIFES